MTQIQEKNLTFLFSHACQASKYDDWSFYRNQFQSVAGGCKAVDIVCITDDRTWLIEIKDYRRSRGTKLAELIHDVATKVRDSLAGLAAAAANANDADEMDFARRALDKRRWRIALHLELPAVRSRLWSDPSYFVNVASKLRGKGNLKGIDSHPVVCSRSSLPPSLPWTVQ